MTVANSLIGLVCIGAFLFVFYGPWQAICTDFARQIVFEERDAIFDLARASKLDFRSAEYKMIRISLEKLIRFAHELTLPRLLFFAWYLDLGRQDIKHNDLFEAISKIQDESTRAMVKRRVLVAHSAMVVMVLAKSLPCWVLLPIMLCAAIVSQFVAHIHKHMKAKMIWVGEIIQAEAECV